MTTTDDRPMVRYLTLNGRVFADAEHVIEALRSAGHEEAANEGAEWLKEVTGIINGKTEAA